MIRGHRLYYGWWIVVAALGLTVLTTGLGYYSYGVFFKPLMGEFGWTRAATSVAQSIYSIMYGAAGLLAAKLIERYSITKIVFLAVLIEGTSFLLLSLTSNLWYLYIVYFLVGLGSGGVGTVTLATVVSNWFIKRRGVAIGITTAGMALGAMLIVPIVGFIIESSGWRLAFIFMGLLFYVVGIPLALFVLKKNPEEMGLLPDGEKQLNAGKVMVEANAQISSATGTEKGRLITLLNSLPIWVLSAGFFLAYAGENAILVHEVPFATDMGVPAMAAAVALGFTGGIGGIGKVVLGWLTDKLSTRYVVLICFTIQIVGVLILMQTRTMAMLWLFVVVFGFGMGGAAALVPLSVGDRFGIASFGIVFGIVNFLGNIGSAVGPYFAGYVFDVTGAYSFAFTTFIVTYIVAIILVYYAWGLNPRPIKSLRR
jgi:sugar phosphate permease